MIDSSIQSNSLPLQTSNGKISNNSPHHCTVVATSTSTLSKLTVGPVKSLFFNKNSSSMFKGIKRRTCTSSVQSTSSSSTASTSIVSTVNDDTESSVCSAGANSVASGSCSSIGATKRSCFKGTRCGVMASRNVKKTAVRFGNRKFSKFAELHTVPSFLEYAEDLWWSRSELDQCRKQQIDFSDAPEETKRAVKTFLESYEFMRQEFYSSVSNKKGQLHFSSEQYYNLAKGFAYGFNGLEKLVGFDTEERRRRTKESIQKTIECYKLTGIRDENAVLNFSKALTSKDRYWSRATGNAASVAAH